MKKLMIAAAVAAVAGATFADVSSANVVGYQAYTLPTEGSTVFPMGVVFNSIGVRDGAYTIGEDFFGNELARGDVVYTVDADLWDFNSYTFNGYTKEGAFRGWGVALATGDEDSIVSFDVTPGQGVFLEPGDTDQTPTISGEVAESGTQTVEFDTDEATTFSFTNPFPVATTFADMEEFVERGDVVYVVDPDLWDFTSYTYNGYNSKTGAYNGWGIAYADGSEDTIRDNTQTILPAGQSAFLEPGDSRSWEVTLNY